MVDDLLFLAHEFLGFFEAIGFILNTILTPLTSFLYYQ